MAITKAKMEEKQALIDKYEKDKPWLTRAIEFVSENFWACAGALGGTLGLMKCDNNALWGLSAGVLAVSTWMMMDKDGANAAFKQVSSALGFGDAKDDKPAARRDPAFNPALTPT